MLHDLSETAHMHQISYARHFRRSYDALPFPWRTMKFSDDCRRISFYQTKVFKPAYLTRLYHFCRLVGQKEFAFPVRKREIQKLTPTFSYVRIPVKIFNRVVASHS